MARHKRNQNKRKGAGRKVVSIIVEGETEKWYFDMLRKNETSLKINIAPDLPKKKTLKQVFETVKEKIREQNDQIIWIVDGDTLVHDNTAREFERYRKELEKYKHVHVLVNMPCLEFWILLHFENTGKYFPKCKGAADALKTYLKDYEKSRTYYTKRDNDIYKKLRPQLETAILNAHKRGRFDIENLASAKSEIYRLFCLLKISEVSPDCSDMGHI